MATGWVLIHRQVQDHWIWQDANKFKWWVDVLLTVNTVEAKVQIGNELFICKRGESLLSIQSWASRWKVSKDTARNFLTLLEKDKMINRVNIGKSTRLTVCNYDSYQKPLHVKQTDAVRQHDTNKEVNNEITEKSDFELLFDRWLRYKKDRKENYTSDDSKETAFKKLLKLSDGKISSATEIIEEALANNWAGFFALKTNNQSHKNNSYNGTEVGN